MYVINLWNNILPVKFAACTCILCVNTCFVNTVLKLLSIDIRCSEVVRLFVRRALISDRQSSISIVKRSVEAKTTSFTLIYILKVNTRTGSIRKKLTAINKLLLFKKKILLLLRSTEQEKKYGYVKFFKNVKLKGETPHAG